jgi:hypothetical protein
MVTGIRGSNVSISLCNTLSLSTHTPTGSAKKVLRTSRKPLLQTCT